MKLPQLSEVLSYEFPELVKKFSRDHRISPEDSEFLFIEMKKMLWLMIKHKLEDRSSGDPFPVTLAVFRPMDPLDKMWHEFILFTHEYFAFCEKYFGGYIHHIPCSEAEILAFQERRSTQKEEFESQERARIRLYLEYIEKHLGRETLERWFKGLPVLTV